MLKLNIAVIAGYGMDVDRLPMHRNFVKESIEFGLNNDTDLFFVIGGDTNPDYPGKTEADASFRVIKEEFSQYDVVKIPEGCDDKFLDAINLEKKAKESFLKLSTKDMSIELALRRIEKIRFILPVVVLGTGNTSADTLIAVRDFLRKRKVGINKLILCSEIARSTGFDLDALFVGLKEILVEDENPDAEFIFYGRSFPETKNEIQIQKKKLLLKILSHYYPIFEWLRQKYQKRHQRKVAKLKRGK